MKLTKALQALIKSIEKGGNEFPADTEEQTEYLKMVKETATAATNARGARYDAQSIRRFNDTRSALVNFLWENLEGGTKYSRAWKAIDPRCLVGRGSAKFSATNELIKDLDTNVFNAIKYRGKGFTYDDNKYLHDWLDKKISGESIASITPSPSPTEEDLQEGVQDA